MNIFRSKLPHVQFHNDNLGGVNYELLKQQQIGSEDHPSNRKRRSTFQDYISPLFIQEPTSETYYSINEKQTNFSSTSAKFKSETQSPLKTQENSSLNNFMDID